METYVINNAQGDSITVTNLGARITQWLVDVGGEKRNIVVGHDQLEDYLTDPFYLGAIVGPYANRIAESRVNADEHPIELVANEQNHHLHGGPNSISGMLWQCEAQTENSVNLACSLPDGFNGYPGAIVLKVTYQLVAGDLNIKLSGSSEQPTIIGPTAHPYFNLSGNKQSIDGHSLQVNSKTVAEFKQGSGIPSGKQLPVADSHFDFRELKVLKVREPSALLDNNFFIKPELSKEVVKHALLASPDGKLTLEVFSDYPSIQVYTGAYLNKRFLPYQGMCLEPQFAPNSPNQPVFPFELTTADKPFEAKIIYRVNKKADKSA